MIIVLAGCRGILTTIVAPGQGLTRGMTNSSSDTFVAYFDIPGENPRCAVFVAFVDSFKHRRSLLSKKPDDEMQFKGPYGQPSCNAQSCFRIFMYRK